jgi:copper oxidase (laccase) domain-containing protein
LLAWLGPCIGPSRFEVGEDVLHAFGQELGGRNPARFVPRQRPDGSPRWLCRLQQLARDRLEQVGVLRISGTDACTFEDPSRFFSFRRDGVTGRHAVSVWRR